MLKLKYDEKYNRYLLKSFLRNMLKFKKKIAESDQITWKKKLNGPRLKTLSIKSVMG